MKKITTEQMLEDAELAATFLRTLVEKGVPLSAATTLTGQYLQTAVFARVGSEKPQEPWNPDGA
jgi:hypothetical protein